MSLEAKYRLLYCRKVMSKIFNAFKWFMTRGRDSQAFLDAWWIERFLDKIPVSKKRMWALRVLNLSPHYFIFPDAPEFKGMGRDEYLEAALKSCNQSREKIFDILLKEHFDENYTVLDYGCGPGFMAKAVAPAVKQVYGIDISSGVLACAQIINFADNISYLKASDQGLSAIADESIDVIYSYAVVQHLTNEVLNSVLSTCHKKLKSYGKLLLHIQLLDENWRTENDWKNDTSISGKLKYNYGLHCFSRTESDYISIVQRHDFDKVEIKKIEGFDAKYDEELQSQRLLIARKSA